MSDDGDSDHDPPVAFEADAGPNERDLARRYAEEDDFQCDISEFGYFTLDYCFTLLHNEINDLNVRIMQGKFRIDFLNEEMQECENEDQRKKLRDMIDGIQSTLASSETKLEVLNHKLNYVDEKLEEVQLSESDTDGSESESEGEIGLPFEGLSDSEGELGLTREEQSDSEEDRDLNREERSESEAELDDTVHSGWRRLLRQHQITIDVAAFLNDTNLRDVDIQPFVDIAEHGTAEEVQRGIDALRDIFSDLLARRRARYSATLPEDCESGLEPDYYSDDAYDEDRSMEYFDIAEIVIENLINELLVRQELLQQ